MIFKFILFLVLISNFNLYAKELEKVSLRLQWLDQFQFAGYYMAQEKGFYNDYSLDVKIKKFNKHIDMIEEVTTGEITYAIGRSSLIVNKSKGAEIKLLMSTFQSSPAVLLTTKKAQIHKVQDFIGKKIMTTLYASLAISIKAMAMQSGVKLEDMVMQEHSFDINSLINRETDLMSSYISNEPFLLKQLGIEYTVFDPKEHGFDFYSDILYTSNKEIIQHKQRTINFTLASIKGWEYAFENIQESVDLIYNKYNTQNKSKDALLFEANELKKLAYFKTNKLGKINAHKIQRIYDIYNVMGLVNDKLDTNDFIFTYHEDAVNLTQEEQSYLDSKKNIRVCTMPDSMPYSKISNNDFIGITADYVKLLSKKLDVKFKFIPTTSWSESHRYIKENRCDILPIAQKTPSRESYLNFTNSYISNPLVIVTSIDKGFINNIENISDKKLAIAKGYSHLELLKLKYPNIDFIEVQNQEIGLHQVECGEIYGFIGDLSSNTYAIQRGFQGLLKVSGYAGEEIDVRIAIEKSQTQLVSILNKAIAKTSEDEKQLILNKWMSIKIEKLIDYKFVWKLLAGFVFILSIIALFIYRQNKHNKELENSKEQLQQYLDLMSDGFAIVNATSRKFVFCNKAFEKLTGYKFEILRDMTKSQIHPNNSLSFIEEQMKQEAKGLILTAKNIPILNKNGDMSVCDVNSNAIEINNVTYYFGIFKSNSDNIEINHKLRLENKKLSALILSYEKQLK